jgi:hypothetical protein
MKTLNKSEEEWHHWLVSLVLGQKGTESPGDRHEEQLFGQDELILLGSMMSNNPVPGVRSF